MAERMERKKQILENLMELYKEAEPGCPEIEKLEKELIEIISTNKLEMLK